jgi:hypothetical protein
MTREELVELVGLLLTSEDPDDPQCDNYKAREEELVERFLLEEES